MGLAGNQTKYLTKVVVFGGQKMTLYSLDGNTWSTRKVELTVIKERHEQQRAELAGKKDEVVDDAVVGKGPASAKLAREDDEVEDPIVDDLDYVAPLGKVAKVDDEEEELPFSIADDEVEDDIDTVVQDKTTTPLRAKSGATGKLPIKPKVVPFVKAKTSVKLVPNKAKTPPKKVAKVKAKKPSSPKQVKSKKPKATNTKKKKAA